MQKYRRFAVNLKGRCARNPAFTHEQRRILPRGHFYPAADASVDRDWADRDPREPSRIRHV